LLFRLQNILTIQNPLNMDCALNPLNDIQIFLVQILF